MVWEIVALVGLAAVFVVLKVLQSEGERKRRLERAERDLRVKAASGGFAPKQWESPQTDDDEGEDGQEPATEEDPEAPPKED